MPLVKPSSSERVYRRLGLLPRTPLFFLKKNTMQRRSILKDKREEVSEGKWSGSVDWQDEEKASTGEDPEQLWNNLTQPNMTSVEKVIICFPYKLAARHHCVSCRGKTEDKRLTCWVENSCVCCPNSVTEIMARRPLVPTRAETDWTAPSQSHTYVPKGLFC